MVSGHAKADVHAHAKGLPGDLPQSRRGRRGDSSRRNKSTNRCQKSRLWARRRRRRWLPRLWTGRRLKAAGFFELVRPHEDDELGDTAIAQHDDDAPSAPKLAPENDDDDTSGKEAEAWLDQGKVPEGDWLDAGVEADVSGDESDDDQGDDGVNLDTEGRR